MNTATIYFSDKSTVILKEGDLIIPIIQHKENDDVFVSMGESIEIYNHINNGLIPALLEALYTCKFFYINTSDSPIYGTSCIVKVENN
ncbi:MAG: hypothetical protein LUG90_21480 [Clostridiaceae bacterium]|nr:hypothetical protein [Clostridiaceae bacterium]